ncbi:hypothetical protein CG419_07460 [Latilactobacillus curvatus]|uniref:Uncharacterized protein n=1 Tax=Latilactobacillus curvatus TaxID=28038 RepID=A0AAC9UPS0_LATCU|nr:hypothetical protein CG419_07460 [Latilactobacillus curvatus]
MLFIISELIIIIALLISKPWTLVLYLISIGLIYYGKSDSNYYPAPLLKWVDYCLRGLILVFFMIKLFR